MSEETRDIQGRKKTDERKMGISIGYKVEIDWGQLGGEFAHLTDDLQAQFLTGLAKETLIFTQQPTTGGGIDWIGQFLAISSRLSNAAKERLRELFEAVLWEVDDEH